LYFRFLSYFRWSWLPPFPFLPHLHTSFSCFLGLHVGLGLRNHPTLAALHYVADKLSPLDFFSPFPCVKLPKGKKVFIFLSGCLQFLHIAAVFIITHFSLGKVPHSDSFCWFLSVLHITSSGVELRSWCRSFGFCAIGFWEVWVWLSRISRMAGGGAAPPPKQDELQPHPVKDQLPNVSFCITSPPPWRKFTATLEPFSCTFLAHNHSGVELP